MTRWMQSRPAGMVAVALGGLLAATWSTGGGNAGRSASTGSARIHQEAARALPRLPLHFEANHGQADGRVKLLSRGRDYGLFLTPDEVVMHLVPREGAGEPWQLRMRLEGADRGAQLVGEEALDAKVNYLRGSDPSAWRTGVPTFGRARYHEVYPGTDLVLYGNGSSVQYDFVLQPGADPASIRWAMEGASRVALDAAGDLVIGGPGGEVRQAAPRLYQEAGGKRRPVEGRFSLLGEDRVGFEVGPYDPSLPLVIDPTIYSTYLGGSAEDDARDIAVSGGYAYVTGFSASVNFPLDDRFQPDRPGTDATVTKLSADGSKVLYSTYLGGGLEDEGHGIAVADGNAYVVGWTNSTDFPTKDPLHADKPGSDAFVSKLSHDGAKLEYSTYLGGTGAEQALGVDVADGYAFVTGFTDSADFPVEGGFQPDQPGRDAFVARLGAGGSGLVYSTYLGGALAEEGHDVAVADGEAYVAGFTDSANFPLRSQYQTDQGSTDAFVARVRNDGAQLISSTYLGGDLVDRATSLVVDDGNVYVAGLTDSVDFPLKSRYQADQPGTDGFVTKLRPDGAQTIYSTYLGGGGNDQVMALDVADSAAYVVGFTDSADFPTTRNPLRGDTPGFDAFVTKLNAEGSGLALSTYVGGAGHDGAFGVAVDSNRAYVAGSSDSTDFPLEDRYQPDQPGRDAFVTKIST